MKLYENIVVGSFLFGLGLRLGRNNPEMIGANLLQQSPWDKPLADVLLTSASICRIIEFKRSENKDKKEAGKHALLVLSINDTEQSRAFLPLSRRIHWYVEIDDVADEQIGFRTRATPYYDLGKAENYIDLPEFMELTAQEACNEALSETQVASYKSYLTFLTEINQRVSEAEVTKTGAAPGALVLTATKNGQLLWLTTDDFGDMFLTRQGYELKFEIELGRQRDGYSRYIPEYQIPF